MKQTTTPFHFRGLIALSTLSMFILFAACTEDNLEEEIETLDDNTAFITTIEGKINGQSFETKGGRVEIAPDGTNDANTTEDLFIQLFNKYDHNNICDVTFRNTNSVSFRPPLEVGVHELYFDEETNHNNGVYFTVIGDQTNYNAYDGYVEILSIDESTVRGTVDAKIDNNFWIKGDFEVSFCDN
ncbi:hypothetical protein [Marinoscillum sp.]|uniref:hypothetical protein n=1 Tax=Marinoscillum sp. TaxID=2024838 RepID=UPI003BAA6DA5